MIEYLVKLLTDKPVISFIEDPLASSEIAGWVKLKVHFLLKIEKDQVNRSYKEC